jgi:hypothetical protein
MKIVNQSQRTTCAMENAKASACLAMESATDQTLYPVLPRTSAFLKRTFVIYVLIVFVPARTPSSANIYVESARPQGTSLSIFCHRSYSSLGLKGRIHSSSFSSKLMNWPNKLECLLLAGFSMRCNVRL